MSIKIIKAGILDTIQDRGRYGHQQYGINPAGAMDVYSMQLANILVGNDMDSPVIELHFPASVFLFTQPALIALTGADFSASINGEPIPSLHPVMLAKNDLLHFHKPAHGARAYLAIEGELLIDQWLNSYSTNMKAKAGGYKGRSLLKDDEINFSGDFPLNQSKQFKLLPWQVDTNWLHDEDDEPGQLFVLKGNEWDQLTNDSKELFTNESFAVSAHSDRMGYRLDSNALTRSTHEELVSSAVSFGTIQLLPTGKMIILAADHQTTGGYPRIAHVISAHHSKLAQLRAGDKIKFQFVELETAEKLLLKQQQHLIQIRNACTFKLQQMLDV